MKGLLSGFSPRAFASSLTPISSSETIVCCCRQKEEKRSVSGARMHHRLWQ